MSNTTTPEMPLRPGAPAPGEGLPAEHQRLVNYIYQFAWQYGRHWHLGDAEKIKAAIAERMEMPEAFAHQLLPCAAPEVVLENNAEHPEDALDAALDEGLKAMSVADLIALRDMCRERADRFGASYNANIAQGATQTARRMRLERLEWEALQNKAEAELYKRVRPLKDAASAQCPWITRLKAGEKEQGCE